ncbi:hypothetical protein R1flu_021691 [Riccia fluitans]|uniref:Uncharacterized protein n=1 Tax=Riccia fluitans TaxID=41844 RepID=A0ABD1ZQ38_9MARC
MSGKIDFHSGLGFFRHRVGQWNVFTLIRDAVKLSFRSPLPSIQFSLLLPHTILFFYLAQSNISSPSAWNAFLFHQPGQVQAPGVSSLLGTRLLQAILSLISSSLVIGAVLYAAGSIYQGKKLTFFEVIKLVPGLWRGLLVTSLVYLVPTLLLSFRFGLTTSVFFYVTSFANPPVPVILAVLVLAIVSWTIGCIIAIMFSVANCVVCFEKEYGVAAFKRARKILHSKWGTAVGISILLFVAETLLKVVLFKGLKESLVHGFEWQHLLSTTFCLIFRSYLLGLKCISWALFYFSCMADSAEDSTHSLKESTASMI